MSTKTIAPFIPKPSSDYISSVIDEDVKEEEEKQDHVQHVK